MSSKEGSGGAGTSVWAKLTKAERQRVLKAYKSSLDPRNLTSTEEVMKRFKLLKGRP